MRAWAILASLRGALLRGRLPGRGGQGAAAAGLNNGPGRRGRWEVPGIAAAGGIACSSHARRESSSLGRERHRESCCRAPPPPGLEPSAQLLGQFSFLPLLQDSGQSTCPGKLCRPCGSCQGNKSIKGFYFMLGGQVFFFNFRVCFKSQLPWGKLLTGVIRSHQDRAPLAVLPCTDKAMG